MNQPPQSSNHPESSRPFDAAVQAAFGDPAVPGTPVADQATVAALRDLIALLREAPLDRPSNALRSKAERLMAAPSAPALDLASVLRNWLQAARQVAMGLVAPGGNAGELVPSLAGFRGAAAPVRTYRAQSEATPSSAAIDAWLDLQVDPIPGGSRLRGQVTCEGGSQPAMIHLLDTASGNVVASEPIAADGTFLATTDSSSVSIAIELDEGDTALVIGGVVLRT